MVLFNAQGVYNQSRPSRYYTPDRSLTCHNCNKTGHLVRSCPIPRVGPPPHTQCTHTVYTHRTVYTLYCIDNDDRNGSLVTSLVFLSIEATHLCAVWTPGPLPEGLSWPALSQLRTSLPWVPGLPKAPCLVPTLPPLWDDWTPL